MREGVAWRTMAITDRRRLGVPARATTDEIATVLTAYAAAAADAGVDALQVREYDLPDGCLRRVTGAIVDAVAGRGLAVLVNERAHVAAVAGAAGVHVRSSGMPAQRVRAVVGPGAVVGRSLHAGDRLASDELKEVDYVLFGTVFTSPSKAPDHPVAGVAALAACCATIGRPVLAVGGVTVQRCATVAAAGAVGVAGIALFADAWQQGRGQLGDLVARVRDAWARAEAQ